MKRKSALKLFYFTAKRGKKYHVFQMIRIGRHHQQTTLLAAWSTRSEAQYHVLKLTQGLETAQ